MLKLCGCFSLKDNEYTVGSDSGLEIEAETEHFSAFYDSNKKIIYVLYGEDWSIFQIAPGIAFVMTILKRRYLSRYEKYLVEKIKTENKCKKRRYYIKYLKKYYFFLACLMVQPSIIEHENYRFYVEVKNKIKQCDTESITKRFLMILESTNIDDSIMIYKKTIGLFDVVEEFYLLLFNR